MEYNVLFGSKMLHLQNPHDEDWVVFSHKKKTQGSPSNLQNIEFQRKKIQHFIDGKSIPDDFEKTCYIYQRSAGFHTHITEYPFADFNILEHKAVWIKQLQANINLEETEHTALKSDKLFKHFYHYLYQYYMIIENTHWISPEAKIKVQAIHDREYSSTYFYELRDLINSLKYEED